jgi:hypothetical protein
MRMTRWHRATAAIALAMMGGCSRPSSGNDGAAISPANNVTAEAQPLVPSPTPTPTSAPMSAPVAKASKTDLLDFSYAYPALSVPAVAAQLAARATEAQTKATVDARDDQREAVKSGYPFHPHDYQAVWKVTADTPRLLSAVGTIYTYTGGAHGMTVFAPILWDKASGKPIAIADLFTSPAAMDQALRGPFCAALDKERAKRRGAPVKHDDDPFDACIDPAKEVIVPVARGSAIDHFTVYVAPYDAGPYAESDYQIDVRVTASVLAAIRADDRKAFAVSG